MVPESNAELAKLQRVVSVRFLNRQQKLTEFREGEWQRLGSCHPAFTNWVDRASRLVEQILKQDAEAWIRVQKEVSREFAEPRLLCPPQLKHLREEIDDWLALALQNLKDQIEKTAAACGFTGLLFGIDYYYTVIRNRVTEVVVTCLEMLEAEAAATNRVSATATVATRSARAQAPIGAADTLPGTNPKSATIATDSKKPDESSRQDAGPTLKVADNGKEGRRAATWDTVELLFLSDKRVQVCKGGVVAESYNYGELGFADRRTGNPNRAWGTLRAMAEAGGIIRDGSNTGQTWPKVEKRVQDIRKLLRKHFCIDSDPISFVPGMGYKARFKIRCSPSYET